MDLEDQAQQEVLMVQIQEFIVHHHFLLFGHLVVEVVDLIGAQLKLVLLVVLEVEMLRVVILVVVVVLEI